MENQTDTKDLICEICEIPNRFLIHGEICPACAVEHVAEEIEEAVGGFRTVIYRMEDTGRDVRTVEDILAANAKAREILNDLTCAIGDMQNTIDAIEAGGHID